MKKIIFCLFLFVLFFNFVSAGVSPASYTIDFKPDLKQDFLFTFRFNKGAEAEIYASGYLAEYVRLDKKKIKGTEEVMAYLSLPSDIEIPGEHKIRVGAREIIENPDGFALASDVGGVIKIKVPYPGKYIELGVGADDANVGEDVFFSINAENKGKESVIVKPVVSIFDLQNNFIEEIILEEVVLQPTQRITIRDVLSTEGYGAGNYLMNVSAPYGGESVAYAHTIFRLGELFVDIINHTRVLERDKINRFEIRVESFWNNEIENMYATMSVIDYSTGFTTPTIDILKPWEQNILTGFLDTSMIEEDEFRAEITLHYENETTEKVVDLRFKEEFDYMFWGIIGLMIIILVLVVIIFLLLRRRKK